MIDDMQTITEQAAKDARDVFESYGSKAREAIDYMEQLIYAALRNTERAIPAADARADALREAAEIARDFEANGVCGIQKCTGGMIRKQILALIGGAE